MKKVDTIETQLFKKEKFKIRALWIILTLIIASMLGMAGSYITILHEQEISNKFIGSQAVERMVLSNFEGQVLYLDERLEAARKIVKSNSDVQRIKSFELLKNYSFKNTAIRNIVVLDAKANPIAFSPSLDLPMTFDQAVETAKKSIFDIPVSTTVVKGDRRLGARVLAVHSDKGQYVGAVIGVIDPSWVDELTNDIFKSYGMRLSLIWNDFEIASNQSTVTGKNQFTPFVKESIENKSVNLDLIARSSYYLFESGLFWTRSLVILIFAIAIGIICLIAGAILIQTIYKKQTRVSIRAHMIKVDADLHAKFIANMSHELRTPVSGILAACEILNTSGVNADQQKMIHLISTASGHLINLLNAILDDSKIQADALALNRKYEKILPILNNCIELFTPLAQSKGVSIVTECSIPPEVWVKVDQLRLIQVLTNLIANAVKFTQEGSIRVTSSLSFSSTENDFGLLSFSFKDTGIGIPKTEIENLFKPFFQVDSTVSRTFGGTGLGLSITKKLIELMDGRIQVQSELDKGSEFVVTLPVECQFFLGDENAEPIGEEILTGIRSLNDLKILLVDDNEMIRSVYSTLIQSLGCQCVLAKDGLEAIACFESDVFDAILMDCHMPSMDGFVAAQQIRHLELMAQRSTLIPIIALSASLSDQDRQKGFDVGMNEFCTKPIKRKALEDLLIKVCEIQ